MPVCKDCGKRVTFYATHCYECFHSKHNPRGFSGKKHTAEWKKEAREGKLAEKNPMWRGDRVGLNQLHVWVRTRIPKPELCERCKSVPPIDLSNNGVYDRNPKNWEWLCRKCHFRKDKVKQRFIVAGQREIKNLKRGKDGRYLKKQR